MSIGYRPPAVNGWTKLSPDELIDAVESYLSDLMETDKYDAGWRDTSMEAYLQGLLDMKKLIARSKKGIK